MRRIGTGEVRQDLDKLLAEIERGDGPVEIEHDGKVVAVLGPTSGPAAAGVSVPKHSLRSDVVSAQGETDLRALSNRTLQWNSSELLQAVIDASPNLINFKDREGRYIVVNPAHAAFYGMTPREMQGKSVFETSDPAYARLTRQRDREIMASAEAMPGFEEEAPDVEGKLTAFHTNKLPLFDPHGTVAGVLTISFDISKRRAAEDALKTSEARLGRALHQTRLAYSVFDIATEEIAEWSTEASGIIGVAPDGLPRNHAAYLALIHPDDRKMVAAAHRDSRAPGHSGSQLEYRLLRPDGKVTWLRETSEIEHDEDGTPLRGLSTIQDITAIRSAEEAIRMRDAWLRSIFENAPFQIALKDTEGRMFAVSRNVADYTGHKREDFIGRTTADFLPPDIAEIYMAADRKVVETGETIQQETVEDIDGIRSYFFNSKFPMRNDSGHIVGVCSMTSDITELRQMQEQLHQARKMESIGQLTGGVAHDFNNLLAVIQGNCELLGDRLADQSRHLTAIMRATARGSELTQHLLAYSRRQTLCPESVDVAALLAELRPQFADALGASVTASVESEAGLWQACADRRQVIAALKTLVTNAGEAMPDGGRFSITCSNIHLDERYVEDTPETVVGDYVEIAIADTGCGMTPQVVERAVDPFFTTKDIGAGSGLGLSMVYGFAKQSGGHITIDSGPGRGTTVKLYLPRYEDGNADRDQPAGRLD